ncbi:MAG: type II toxin-antitoxin system death-on-curing family toxin [Burkholderiales bacterium]|nr:type II toxin-antitoxin system death-on-curing family toxin [Burkholderiales bacterium]
MRHLDVAGVLAIHAEVLAAHGGLPGLRDVGLLESAVAAPQASFGGQRLIDDPIEVAAAYLFYLCRNHPFADGNKRTALAAALVFLDANGLLADPGLPAKAIDDWESMVLDIAASKLDRGQTTGRLRARLKG